MGTRFFIFNPFVNAPMDTTEEKSGSSPVKLILSWLFVGLPLLWGTLQTFEKSLALFR